MKILFVICLLGLCACGQSPNDAAPVFVDPIVQPYFDRFTQNIGVSSNGISGYFTKLTAPIVGQCVVYSTGEKDIQIDPTFWANIDDDEREQLIFHELGHCSLMMQHIMTTTTLNNDVCPTSIMYAYVFGNTQCYTNNKAYYYAELASHK